jgi:hypothetical protein
MSGNNSDLENDNITEELSKLLNNTRQVKTKSGNNKKFNNKSTKAKKNNKLFKTKNTQKSALNHDICGNLVLDPLSSDSNSALMQLRVDMLKILEVVNALKTEVKDNKHSLHCKIEKLCKRVSTLENSGVPIVSSSASASSCTTETYEECLDKILSSKLDDLSIKVDTKIEELSKFLFSTRNIAITRNRN